MTATWFGFPVEIRRWGLREWLPAGLILQIAGVLLAELVLVLWPTWNQEAANLDITTEMTFVEYNEIQETLPPETRDLSDEIVEVEELKEEEKINWENAVDPTLDFTQRYSVALDYSNSPDDYPSGARRANVGTVKARVTLYIDTRGRVRDVRIHSVRSTGSAHEPFTQEFRRAIRRVLLTKTRVKAKPYVVNGQAQDIAWDTVFTFRLQ